MDGRRMVDRQSEKEDDSKQLLKQQERRELERLDESTILI